MIYKKAIQVAKSKDKKYALINENNNIILHKNISNREIFKVLFMIYSRTNNNDNINFDEFYLNLKKYNWNTNDVSLLVETNYTYTW